MHKLNTCQTENKQQLRKFTVRFDYYSKRLACFTVTFQVLITNIYLMTITNFSLANFEHVRLDEKAIVTFCQTLRGSLIRSA